MPATRTVDFDVISAEGDDKASTVLIECVATAGGEQPQAGRLGRWHAGFCTLAATAVVLAAAMTAGHAQSRGPLPPPPPSVSTTAAEIGAGSASTLFDLGSRYLQTLGNQGGPGWQANQFGTGPNPGGGGAPAAPAAPKYRAWTELYGLSAQTGAQTNYPGDTRRTIGGVAGLAMTVAPGATLGLSVDQSHSKIGITGLPQSAGLDLTQVGINGSYEAGAWTFSAAGVTGFATVGSDRDTPSGPATASYHANLWGVIGEAAYYIPVGSARIVPKLGTDWTQTHASAYSEVGGIDAVMVPSATAERTRIFAGAEIGNTWVTGTTIDLSAYARAVDILSQRVPVLTVSAVSGPATPVQVFGVTESKYGIDAGAMASVRLSAIARLYALYDGRFREGYQSHGGTLGLELRW
jgi:uncharacterized protein with beta-barrel porin domain